MKTLEPLRVSLVRAIRQPADKATTAPVQEIAASTNLHQAYQHGQHKRPDGKASFEVAPKADRVEQKEGSKIEYRNVNDKEVTSAITYPNGFKAVYGGHDASGKGPHRRRNSRWTIRCNPDCRLRPEVQC